jgi:hypothetical protein
LFEDHVAKSANKQKTKKVCDRTVLLLRKTGGIANGSATQTSKVRSAYLEMSLDHETGTIDGQILTGEREGQFLSNLALHDLLMFYAEVETDEESVKLFETFLDSRHPDWRDQEDVGSARGEETSPFSKQLSWDEAYQYKSVSMSLTSSIDQTLLSSQSTTDRTDDVISFMS